MDCISCLQRRFKWLKWKVLNQPGVKDTQEKLHADFGLVPTYKVANNMIVVCKKYFTETLVKELGVNTTSNTCSTYSPCFDSLGQILKTHAKFPGDLAQAWNEELTNQKHSNAQLCPDMHHNDSWFSVRYNINSFPQQNQTFENVVEHAIPFTSQRIHEIWRPYGLVLGCQYWIESS